MRRRLLIALGLTALVASAAAFAACSDDDKDEGSPGQPTSSNNDGVPTYRHTTPGPESPPTIDGEATTTSSGLQIIDIKEGAGAEAQAGKSLTLHYTGWFESDGTKFSSSRDGDQPFAVILGATPREVIPGWEEGLLGMKEGGERRLVIPPDLAYGAEGRLDSAGNVVIPPNATLIFDVELLDVEDTP